MLVLNTDNANGRCITEEVRRLDAETGGPFFTLSYNTVPGRITTSRFFNRIGKSFAKTSRSGGNTFRVTGKKALFLSRVKGLGCRIRIRLLHTLRREGVHPMKDGGRVSVSVQLMYTAGRGLTRHITRNGFHRSLCRHVGRFAVCVPRLGSHNTSLFLFTSLFVGRTGGRLGEGIRKLSNGTGRQVTTCG